MITLIEYTCKNVWSTKDVDVDEKFLQNMNKNLYEEYKVPEGFEITEDTIKHWINHDECNVKIIRIDDENEDECDLMDWLTDYIGDYFFEKVDNGYIYNTDWYDTYYKVRG